MKTWEDSSVSRGRGRILSMLAVIYLVTPRARLFFVALAQAEDHAGSVAHKDDRILS